MLHKAKATICGRVGNIVVKNPGSDRMSVRVSLFVNKQDEHDATIQESYSVTCFKDSAKYVHKMLRKGDTVTFEDAFMSQTISEGTLYTNFQVNSNRAINIEPKEAAEVMRARFNGVAAVGNLAAAYNASEPAPNKPTAPAGGVYEPNDLDDDLPF